MDEGLRNAALTAASAQPAARTIPATGGLSAVQRGRERSMLLAGVLDCAIVLPMMGAGIWANSLTLMGECVRASLQIALEMFLLVVLRRIHRSRLENFDYGSAKLEQFGNLLVGAGMLIAAIWVLAADGFRLLQPPAQPTLGMAFAALTAFVNVIINMVALWAIWRVGRDGTSIILSGQIRSRLAKLIASALAACAIAVNAAWGAAMIGRLADTAGAVLVAVTMLSLGVSMWRDALPHLLDRGLDEARQIAINRVLVRHFHAYETLGAVRTRWTGRECYIEITLGFASGRPLGEVQTLVDAVARDVRDLIADAQVQVIPVAV